MTVTLFCISAHYEILSASIQYLYLSIKKHSGTILMYKSNYAMRALDSREKGHDIWAREKKGKVHVIGGKDTRVVSLYIYFHSVTIFFQWQRQLKSNYMKFSLVKKVLSVTLGFFFLNCAEADSVLETTLSLIRPTRGKIRTLWSRIAGFVESYSEFCDMEWKRCYM